MQPNHALVIQGKNKIALEERPMPQAGPGEVLINVHYVALCGSDAKLFNGTYTAPHSYPVVLGHEWIGQVVHVGLGVDDFQAGDMVTGDCSLYCGQCSACAVNKNHCRSIQKRGITIDGGSCNYIVVSHIHLYKCPETDDYKPFVLTEPTAVGANGILGRITHNTMMHINRAVILGAGGIGVLSLLSLVDYPIKEIVMVDLAQEKLNLVESFRLPNVSTCQDYEVLNKGFDLVVEAAGATPTLQASPKLAAPAGHIVLLGHQKPAELDFGEIIKKSLTIYASNGSTGGFERALGTISKHKDLVSKLITTTIPLAEAPDYISKQKHTHNNIKVVIDLRA